MVNRELANNVCWLPSSAQHALHTYVINLAVYYQRELHKLLSCTYFSQKQVCWTGDYLGSGFHFPGSLGCSYTSMMQWCSGTCHANHSHVYAAHIRQHLPGSGQRHTTQTAQSIITLCRRWYQPRSSKGESCTTLCLILCHTQFGWNETGDAGTARFDAFGST